MLSTLSTVAHAQLHSFPEFFEKHFHIEAMDADDGPRLKSQFVYSAEGTLITRNLVKMNNDGFEDHMAVGLVQNFAGARTKVTYNLHRFNYTTLDTHSNDVTLDIRYRSLRLQHRIADTEQVSSVGLPVDFGIAHFDFSLSQTLQKNPDETIDLYNIHSRIKQLKFSASWQDIGTDTWTDFTTEYRPSGSWLVKYSYSDHGIDLLRQIRGEYAVSGFRLAGEYSLQTASGAQSHVAGAIDVEKDTPLAVLKLRLEYNNDIETSAIYLKLESHLAF